MSDEKSNSDIDTLARELSALLISQVEDSTLRILRNAFKAQRDLFVFELARKLANLGTTQPKIELSKSEEEWQGIASLSMLRALVGGRFDNIKKKWSGAGFPLREHRGDKESAYILDENGWLELSSWIFKQGFEARLSLDRAHSLFEVRLLKSTKTD